MNIVLLETVSNQPFVFGSNKLREVVGASEMILRVGTKFFLEAVDQVRADHAGASGQAAPQRLGALWERREELTRALTRQDDPAFNPRIEDECASIEVIVAASGKSVAVVRSAEVGRELIRQVTLRAAKEAPGVSVHGAISDDFDLGAIPVHEAVGETFDRHIQARSVLPSVESRYARLPVAASCATSNLPASVYDTDVPKGQRGPPRSAVSVAKRKLGTPAMARQRAERLVGNIPLAENLDELENEFEWFGVVHADGNGFGRIFLEFHQHAQATDAGQFRRYLDALRDFSLQLDRCTQEAFRQAVIWYVGQRGLRADEPVKLVPLVVAGDDLTVLCDGTLAAQFAAQFLETFEELSRNDIEFPMLAEIALRAFKRPGLGACAGVAVVKPHFPFYAAYELAERLADQAKRVKREVYRTAPEDTACSALDVYVHAMSSNADLPTIREEMRGGRTVLYGGPYVVSSEAYLDGLSADSRRWIAPRRWRDLAARVALLGESDPDDPGRPLLPSSLLHRIRERLQEGPAATDGYVRLVQHRYRALRRLLNGGDSLFWTEERPEFKDEAAGGAEGQVTTMLDALSLMKLEI